MDAGSFRRWAAKIGPNTESLIGAVLASRPHPEQGFRTCLGILRWYRGLDAGRTEAVFARAMQGYLIFASELFGREEDFDARRRYRAPSASLDD